MLQYAVLQIVALSGAGFTLDVHPELDDYVLALLSSRRPRICYLPTASSDSPSSIQRFYRRFPEPAFVPWHLELCAMNRTQSSRSELLERMLAQDLIYVGGGNTGDLLDVWQRHDFVPLLRAAAEAGSVLAGVSAGAACWFQCFATDCLGPGFARMEGLNFIGGSFCPHYDSDPDRRPAFHRLIATGMPPGFAADDAVALHFRDGALHRAVRATRDANAYRVIRKASGAVEERALLPRRG